mmetsp:Transcript_23143/g.66422  ORF Transcript_23143/g.66422 Transcript_23143/m.66422 type:complete len:577 (+) Transcript_23143:593-2323(+)
MPRRPRVGRLGQCIVAARQRGVRRMELRLPELLHRQPPDARRVPLPLRRLPARHLRRLLRAHRGVGAEPLRRRRVAVEALQKCVEQFDLRGPPAKRRRRFRFWERLGELLDGPAGALLRRRGGAMGCQGGRSRLAGATRRRRGPPSVAAPPWLRRRLGGLRAALAAAAQSGEKHVGASSWRNGRRCPGRPGEAACGTHAASPCGPAATSAAGAATCGAEPLREAGAQRLRLFQRCGLEELGGPAPTSASGGVLRLEAGDSCGFTGGAAESASAAPPAATAAIDAASRRGRLGAAPILERRRGHDQLEPALPRLGRVRCLRRHGPLVGEHRARDAGVASAAIATGRRREGSAEGRRQVADGPRAVTRRPRRRSRSSRGRRSLAGHSGIGRATRLDAPAAGEVACRQRRRWAAWPAAIVGELRRSHGTAHALIVRSRALRRRAAPQRLPRPGRWLCCRRDATATGAPGRAAHTHFALGDRRAVVALRRPHAGIRVRGVRDCEAACSRFARVGRSLSRRCAAAGRLACEVGPRRPSAGARGADCHRLSSRRGLHCERCCRSGRRGDRRRHQRRLAPSPP